MYPTFSLLKRLCLVVLCLIGITGKSIVGTKSDGETEKALEPDPNATEESQSRPPRNITTFNIQTIDSLALVAEHIQDKDYAKAEQKLAAMWVNETELTLSEKAELTYMSSRISYLQQDVEATIGHLEKVLEFREHIAYSREEEILLRLAELYLSEKEHVKAHSRLNEWLSIVEHPKSRELAFAGNVFVRLKDYARAKEYLKQAIEQQKESALEVDEQWFELLDYVEKQLDTAN